MKYLIVIIATLIVGFTYALVKAAGNADKKIEKMQRSEYSDNKNQDTK